jgi:3-hydroxyisobutyrate dehydrogenase
MAGRRIGRGTGVTDAARIGFVGLGNMGHGMAANLVRAGHAVRAFDLSADALERAAAAGCLPVGSAQAAGQEADAIVTMLPAGAHVREVYGRTLIGTVPTTALLIDSSTIDVATARSVGADAAAQGYAMVDAPVSGGIAAAAAGTLTFMVGGTAAAFARAEPILAAMGKVVVHAGGSGAGQAAKIANNMLLGATMVATCEAFLLAEKLELDPQVFFDIASRASGQSWSMTSYCPVPGVGPETPADRDYRGGFSAALMLKDLKLALAAAQDAGAAVPMGALAGSLYQALANAGAGDRDFSAMIRFLAGDLPERNVSSGS